MEEDRQRHKEQTYCKSLLINSWRPSWKARKTSGIIHCKAKGLDPGEQISDLSYVVQKPKTQEHRCPRSGKDKMSQLEKRDSLPFLVRLNEAWLHWWDSVFSSSMCWVKCKILLKMFSGTHSEISVCQLSDHPLAQSSWHKNNHYSAHSSFNH